MLRKKPQNLIKSLKENICRNKDLGIFLLIMIKKLKKKSKRWRKCQTCWLCPLRKTYVKMKILIYFRWEWSESWRKSHKCWRFSRSGSPIFWSRKYSTYYKYLTRSSPIHHIHSPSTTPTHPPRHPTSIPSSPYT